MLCTCSNYSMATIRIMAYGVWSKIGGCDAGRRASMFEVFDKIIERAEDDDTMVPMVNICHAPLPQRVERGMFSDTFVLEFLLC